MKRGRVAWDTGTGSKGRGRQETIDQEMGAGFKDCSADVEGVNTHNLVIRCRSLSREIKTRYNPSHSYHLQRQTPSLYTTSMHPFSSPQSIRSFRPSGEGTFHESHNERFISLHTLTQRSWVWSAHTPIIRIKRSCLQSVPHSSFFFHRTRLPLSKFTYQSSQGIES